MTSEEYHLLKQRVEALESKYRSAETGSMTQAEMLSDLGGLLGLVEHLRGRCTDPPQARVGPIVTK